MNQRYTDALEDAIFLYRRFQWQKQNNRDHPGTCFRDDKEIYLVVDQASADEERCRHLMEWLMLFAQDHKNWSPELEQWCMEVLNREPIHIRTKDDRWKKNNRNNTQMWKLMMQYQEEVLRRLDEDHDAEANTFSQHFEFQGR